jgi:hypothetical protein
VLYPTLCLDGPGGALATNVAMVVNTCIGGGEGYLAVSTQAPAISTNGTLH